MLSTIGWSAARRAVQGEGYSSARRQTLPFHLRRRGSRACPARHGARSARPRLAGHREADLGSLGGHQPWPGGGWRRPRPACGRRASFLHKFISPRCRLRKRYTPAQKPKPAGRARTRARCPRGRGAQRRAVRVRRARCGGVPDGAVRRARTSHHSDTACTPATHRR